MRNGSLQSRLRRSCLISILLVFPAIFLYGNFSILKDVSVRYKKETSVVGLSAFDNTTAMENNVVSTVIVNETASGINQHRPLFIIHVGPPKTGSTTLQCTLESLLTSLESDNYAYIGRPECIGKDIPYDRKKDFREFSQALVTDYPCHMALQDVSSDNTNITEQPFDCWKKFIDKMEYYKRQNRNVIFSDEAMSNRIARADDYRPRLPYPWNALRSVLQGWDVRFLTLHRPFYDYLPSVYNEKYKIGPLKRKLQLWYKTNHDNDRCIDQGGKIVPKPFDVEGYVYTIAKLMEPGQNMYPTPVQIYELLQNYSSNSSIMLVDLNHRGSDDIDDDFISHIICNKIPGLHHTCNALRKMRKNETDSTKQRNPSIPLHYDLIATEACKQGIVNGNILTRNFVRNAVREYHEEINGRTANDLPITCPDDMTLQKLLDMSLDHERKIQGLDWEEGKQKQFMDKFWIAANDKKKFCSVDSKAVVENEEWKNFLQTLVQPE